MLENSDKKMTKEQIIENILDGFNIQQIKERTNKNEILQQILDKLKLNIQPVSVLTLSPGGQSTCSKILQLQTKERNEVINMIIKGAKTAKINNFESLKIFLHYIYYKIHYSGNDLKNITVENFKTTIKECSSKNFEIEDMIPELEEQFKRSIPADLLEEMELTNKIERNNKLQQNESQKMISEKKKVEIKPQWLQNNVIESEDSEKKEILAFSNQSTFIQQMIEKVNNPETRDKTLKALEAKDYSCQGYKFTKYGGDSFSISPFDTTGRLNGEVFFEDNFIQISYIAESDKPKNINFITFNPHEQNVIARFTRTEDGFIYKDADGSMELPDKFNPELNKFLLQMCDTETESDIKLDIEEIRDSEKLKENLDKSDEQIVAILCQSPDELRMLLNNIKKIDFAKDVFKIELSGTLDHDLVCYKRKNGEIMIIDQGGILNENLSSFKEILEEEKINIICTENPSKEITCYHKNTKGQMISETIELPNDESVLCCRHAINLIYEKIREMGIDKFLDKYITQKQILRFMETSSELYKNKQKKMNSSVKSSQQFKK